MNDTNHIAFYGTLTHSGRTILRDALIKYLRPLGPCKIPGQLFDLGRMPALKAGAGSVEGELYEIVHPQFLPILDGYEATDQAKDSLELLPPGFTRKAIKLIEPKVDSWVYFYDGDVQEKQRIVSGQWAG